MDRAGMHSMSWRPEEPTLTRCQGAWAVSWGRRQLLPVLADGCFQQALPLFALTSDSLGLLASLKAVLTTSDAACPSTLMAILSHP